MTRDGSRPTSPGLGGPPPRLGACAPMRGETLLILFYARPRPKSRGFPQIGDFVLPESGIFGEANAEGLEKCLHQFAAKQVVREIFLRGATPAI